MTNEVIEYEPVKPKSDLRFWFVMAIGVVLFMIYAGLENQRIREERDARIKAERSEKIDRAIQIRALQRLNDLAMATEDAEHAARENRR